MDPSNAFMLYDIHDIIENENYDFVGGGEIRVSKYIKFFKSRGFNVEIITQLPKDPRFRVKGKNKVLYFNIHDPRKPVNFFLALKLFKSLKLMKSEVVYRRVFNPDLFFLGLFGRLFKKRIIYNFASDLEFSFIKSPFSLKETFFKLQFLAGLFLCSKLILQSEHQQTLIPGILKRKCFLLKKGVDQIILDDEIAPFSDRRFFFWVGRFDRVKAPGYLMKLAPLGMPIKIAGRIPESFRSLLKRLQDFKNVEYLGILKPSELKKYYSKAFALINTSFCEGFPETFLEAWNCGTPVITRKFDLDNIRARNAGLYAHGSTGQFLEYMKQISSEKAFFDRLSSAARALIKDELNSSREMKSLVKILSKT